MSYDLGYEGVAQIAHAAVEQMDRRQFGYVVRPWESVPYEVQRSSILTVEYIYLRPEVTGRDVHERWCEIRREEGWNYGQEFSREDKTSALMVPWEELPDYKKPACELVVAIVRSLSPLIVSDFAAEIGKR